MGQSLGLQCRPVLKKCNTFCCDGECTSVQELIGCTETFPRGSILRKGEQTPLLATHVRLVTDCDPPQGIADYDLLLVNQVYNVCGQLSDGDLSPFMRSRIDCECNNHRHIASFDTNLLHDEIVALCVIVRYDPAVEIKTCDVYVEAPGVQERLAEFRAVGEHIASPKGVKKIEDKSKQHYRDIKQQERVFMAMICSSQNDTLWYFQAVNEEMGKYEEHTVGRIAGAAVVGEELSDEAATVAHTHSNLDDKECIGSSPTTAATRATYAPSRTSRAGGASYADQRAAYVGDVNYNEGTTNVLHPKHHSDRQTSSNSLGGISGMFRMPNIRLPNLWGWGNRESASQEVEQRLTVQDPPVLRPSAGENAPTTLSPPQNESRQRESGGRNISPILPSKMQFAEAQNRFGAQPTNHADTSPVVRNNRSPFLSQNSGQSSMVNPGKVASFENPPRAYPMYETPSHETQRNSQTRQSKRLASQASLNFTFE